MVPSKAFVLALALLSAFGAVLAQPTSLEPVLPPIPDPPYPHKVRFCGIADGATFSLNSTALDNCDWPRYVRSFVPFLAGPVALGAIALVIAIILPFIFCFPCCKRKPIGGLCRMLLFAMFAALVVIGFILIFVGNAKTSKVVHDLTNTINDTFVEADVRLTSARSLAVQLPYTNGSDALQTFDDAAATLRGFKDTSATTSDRVKQYDVYRKAALFVAALVPMALMIASALLVIFNKGRPLMGILAWVLVFLSILVWLCIGVHLAVGKALSDICWEVDLAQAQGSAGTLSILIECDTDTTPLTSLRNQVQEGINNATKDACDILEPTCVSNGGPVDCQPDPWSCEEDNIDDWSGFDMTDAGVTCDDGSFEDVSDGCQGGSTQNGTFSINRVVRDCPTQCLNPRFRAAAIQGVDGVGQIDRYYGVRDELLPLLTCSFVSDAFFSAKESICKDLSKSLTLVFTGAALEAIGMGLAMAALVHCYMGLSGKKDLYNPRDTL
jgi:hypothetical protein